MKGCIPGTDDRNGRPISMHWSRHPLLFEDGAVRVLEVAVKPGERENLHHHRWPSLIVVLARLNYPGFDADGSGAGAAVKFAAVGMGLALTHLDFQIV